MRKVTFFLIISTYFFTLGTNVFKGSVLAVTASDWRAGRIIDDAIFTNKDSLSPTQIQDFLNQKVGSGGYDSLPGQCDITGSRSAQPYSSSSRATYAASLGRPTKFTCLSNYYEVPKINPGPEVPANNYGGLPIPAGAKSAAELIWDAAHRYNISPKVLLVTIQKESAGPLTTDDWPFQKQYTYAMGAHCPDSGPGGAANCDTNYAGFSIQISESASLLRYYLDNMTQPWWPYKRIGNNDILYQNAKPECGSSSVNITTQATAALYTYTPYQPNQAALDNMYGIGDGCSAYGNRNFWRIFNDWFGSPTGSFLQKGSGPTVFVVAEGVKYAIASGAILDIYGWSGISVTPASDFYLNSLTDGGLLTPLFSNPGNPTVFLADNGKKYGIPSGEYCTNWGLFCGDVSLKKTLPVQLTNLLPDGGILKPLMNHNGAVYKLNNGTKEPFLSPQALFEGGYGWGDVIPIVASSNSAQTMGPSHPQNMSLVKFSTSPAFYLYVASKFYTVPSYDTYKSWFLPTDVLFGDDTSSYNSTLPTPSGSIGKYVNSGARKYIIDGGRKLDVTDLNLATTPQDISFIQPLFDRLATQVLIKPNTLRTNSGTIYALRNGQKKPIYSMNDFTALGYTISDVIGIDNESADMIPIGTTLFGPGTLITGSGPAIYAVGNTNKLYALRTYADLQGFGFDTSRVVGVSQALIDEFPALEPLKNITVNEQGVKYLIIDSNRKITFSQTSLELWGVQTSPVTELGNYVLGRVSEAAISPQYARANNGTIYKGEGGTKRPISSYEKYKQLGGNINNTFPASDDFLAAAPNGIAL